MSHRLAIPIILLLHLISAVAYLLFYSKYSTEVAFVLTNEVTYEGLAGVIYFVPEILFPVLMVQSVRKRKLNWVQNQCVDVWIGFMLSRMFIYVLDDLSIFESSYGDRLLFILGYIIVACLWFLINAYREGYLSND
jgi:hypothetical protein